MRTGDWLTDSADEHGTTATGPEGLVTAAKSLYFNTFGGIGSNPQLRQEVGWVF